MAITRVTYPERILIVLNSDGTLKGAHVEYLESLVDGVNVIQSRQVPAAALNGDDLAGVMPAQATLLAQVQSLTDALEASTAARAAMVLDLDAAISERDAAVVARDAAIASAERQIAEIKAETAEQLASAAALSDPPSSGLRLLTPVEIRLGLVMAGIMPEQVSAAIDGIADPDVRNRAATFWDYSLSYSREHPFIDSIGALVGLTPEHIDEIWRIAQSQ